MQQHLWILLAILGAFFAAIVSVLTKRALDKTDFMAAITLQSLVMLLTLAGILTVMGRWSKLSAAPRWALGLIALAGVASAAAWFFGYQALQLSKVAQSTPLDKLSMPFGVVLAMIFLHEKPSAANWIGIVIMLAGAFLVAQSNGKVG